VMAQYYPAGKVSSSEYVEINRRTSSRELEHAVAAAHAAGLRRLDSRAARRGFAEFM